MKSGIIKTCKGFSGAVRQSSRIGTLLAVMIGLALFSVRDRRSCVSIRPAIVHRDL